MKFFENEKPTFNIIKGVLISLLCTIILLTIYSFLLVYTNLQEQTIKPVIITITALSILIGSSLGTKKLKKNGLINGAVIGIIYILFIYLISSISCSNFNLNLSSTIMIVIGVIAGIFGRNHWN